MSKYEYIPKGFDESYDEVTIHKICVALEQLLETKQEYYGTENLCKYGHYGILVRLADKMSRLGNLVERKKEEEPYNIDTEESLYDVYRDIAGYGVMAIKLMKDMKI